ncbi:MAG TPA: hypothetical protein VLJ42_13325 [Solirubrobacteraceae bacterium]|nr:hypothetical protein [Solirubrobacteraceae bacterium]
MPLVQPGAAGEQEQLSEQQERARKIKPQYAEGQLVQVAGARNLTEAEFIQGLLLEEGVPSVLRRARGFDVPDFLAAGPRDVLVAQSGAEVAREVLLQSELIPEEGAGESGMDAPWRVLAWLLAALAIVAIVVWLGNWS